MDLHSQNFDDRCPRVAPIRPNVFIMVVLLMQFAYQVFCDREDKDEMKTLASLAPQIADNQMLNLATYFGSLFPLR